MPLTAHLFYKNTRLHRTVILDGDNYPRVILADGMCFVQGLASREYWECSCFQAQPLTSTEVAKQVWTMQEILEREG